MGTVSDKKCEERMSGKASDTGTKWFLRIILIVLIAVVGGSTMMIRAQGVNSGDIKVNASEIKAQKAQDALGRKYRDAARIEDRAWQNALIETLDKREEKWDYEFDRMMELIRNHEHSGSTP